MTEYPWRAWGLLIREARRHRWLTQADVSKALRVNQGTISGWETGRYKPDDLMKLKLAALLETTPDELFPWQPVMNLGRRRPKARRARRKETAA